MHTILFTPVTKLATPLRLHAEITNKPKVVHNKHELGLYVGSQGPSSSIWISDSRLPDLGRKCLFLFQFVVTSQLNREFWLLGKGKKPLNC